jgi:hypothetical protein
MESEIFKNVGRNEPCPCGSGKKFKRCHGEAQQEWQGNPKAEASTEVATTDGDGGGAEASGGMPSFDPSKMDLNWLAEFSSAIQRLPKGQLQQLQMLMQKAMSGKDVTRELETLQRKLPPSVQELLSKSPELDAQLENASQTSGEAQAVLTDDQRLKLQEIQKNNAKSGLSRLWTKFSKK